MNRQKANTMMTELEAAIKPVLDKHGVTLDRKRGSFDEARLKFSVELLEAGVVEQRLKQFSTGPVDGKTFHFRGHVYKVSGTKPGRDFDWVLADRQPDGKTFRFRPEQVPA